MKKFESTYRIRESDDVLAKENAIHSDIDGRLDAVEADAEAFRAGNNADIQAILASLQATFGTMAAEAEAILSQVQSGLTTDAVTETSARYYLTDLRKAAIVNSILGGVDASGNTLAKLLALIAGKAAPSDIAAAIAALVASAPAGRQTLKGLSDAINAANAAIAALPASLALTGAPTAPTQPTADNSNKIATTAFVAGALVSAAGLSVAVDQSLSAPQRAMGRLNLSAAPWEALADKNLAINARHFVSQFKGFDTAAGFASGAGGYLNDGYQVWPVGPAVSGKIITTSPFASRPDLLNAAQITVTTPKATLAVGEYLHLVQAVEGYRIRGIGWGATGAQPLLVSFVARASVAGTYYATIRNVPTSLSFVHKFTLAANTDKLVSFVVPGATSGSWAIDNTQGLNFAICVGCGSQFSVSPASADTWVNGNYIACSDVTNLAGVGGATFTFSDLILLPLLPGVTDPAVVLPPDRLPMFRRDFYDDLVTSRRYYDVMQNVTLFRTTTSGNFGGGIQDIRFFQSMRSAPSITKTVVSGIWDDASIGNVTNRSALMYFNTGSGEGAYCTYNLTIDARL